ncbi:MAG: glutaredoxin family protein [Xanthomonadales bacterium]|nr:glutaredoxin family protein [Xanthomonadales bacterium]
MANQTALVLYTRRDCHLCDLAAQMLNHARIAWRPVDIDCDEDLVERYGLCVPVVAHPEIGRELTYPFTREELLRFAASVAG